MNDQPAHEYPPLDPARYTPRSLRPESTLRYAPIRLRIRPARHRLRTSSPPHLHILALLPAAREHVPVLGRGADEVALLEQLEVGGALACEQHHVEAEPLRPELRRPVLVAARGHALKRAHVHRAHLAQVLLVRVHQPQNGKLRARRLARAGGGRHQHVVVRVVQRGEHLRRRSGGRDVTGSGGGLAQAKRRVGRGSSPPGGSAVTHRRPGGTDCESGCTVQYVKVVQAFRLIAPVAIDSGCWGGP
eukprot:723188-Prorocentrum_minimum.AAC.2